MAQRAHPGHRRRRRRPPAVPLPRRSGGPGGTRRSTSGCWRSPTSCPTSATPWSRRCAPAGLNRERVLATAVRLLDLGAFRVGSEQYAEENGTYGLATLRREHVHVRGERTFFSYTAKGGIEREVELTDRPTATVVRQLLERPDGRRRGPAGLPGRGRHVAGRDQRRDQRLPQGDQRRGDHRQGLPHLDRHGADGRRRWPRRRRRGRGPRGRRPSSAAYKQVSEQLGNTPAVCKASYVDPRVVDRFENGETVAARPAARRTRPRRTATPSGCSSRRSARCCRPETDDEGPAGNRRGPSVAARVSRPSLSGRCCRRS